MALMKHFAKLGAEFLAVGGGVRVDRVEVCVGVSRTSRLRAKTLQSGCGASDPHHKLSCVPCTRLPPSLQLCGQQLGCQPLLLLLHFPNPRAALTECLLCTRGHSECFHLYLVFCWFSPLWSMQLLLFLCGRRKPKFSATGIQTQSAWLQSPCFPPHLAYCVFDK